MYEVFLTFIILVEVGILSILGTALLFSYFDVFEYKETDNTNI